MNIKGVVSKLKRERQRKRLSQREVAARLGFRDAGSIRALERPNANPTLESVQKYADALGVTLYLEADSMTVLSFFNHAGGAGKTTTARDVGYTLGKRGFKVLMIDTDPQANLTEFFGVDASELHPQSTVYAAVMNDDLDLHLPEPIAVHGLDLIPSHLDLAKADRILATVIGGYQRLQRAVEALEGYDFVILDCAPNLGTLSVAALAASEYVIVPVQLRKKFRDGMFTVIRTIRETRAIQPNITPLMIVPTQADNTVVSRENLEYLRTEFGSDLLISTPITRRPAIYGEAEEEGNPVPAKQPKGDATSEIDAVTSTLLERLNVTVGA